MIRITQRAFDIKTAGQLESLHAAFVQILANQLPPSVAALYATPKADADGTVQWLTNVSGQPRPYAELPVAEAGRLKTVLFERLSALRQYAEILEKQPGHDGAAVELLKHAGAEPPVEAIFSLNGQPVLLYWNHALPPDPKRQVLAAPVVPLAAATVAVVATPVLTKVLRWLAALLVLLVILFLLWWFFCPKSWRVSNVDQALAPTTEVVTPPLVSQVSPPPPPAAQPPEVVKPAEPETPPEPPALRKPVDPPEPEVPAEPVPPLVEVPEPEPELLRPRVVTPEPVPPKPELVPPKVAAPVRPPVPKAITIENAKDVCPEDRPASLAPEMIVVFDASGSMQININATEAEQEWLFKILNAGPNPLSRLSPSDRQKFERLHREPTRIVTAKQATIDVMQRLPKDVGTGLVVVDQCPGGARNLGRFSPSQRGQMINRLSQLRPHQGTPLADGLLQGGELADGVTRQSTILLVSDGEENCGGDPCFVARNLKRQKPHLKINVIDIGGTGAANCAAELTGGKVYTVSNVKELNLAVERATQETLGPAHCAKPN
jgi:hypothetical protein